MPPGAAALVNAATAALRAVGWECLAVRQGYEAWRRGQGGLRHGDQMPLTAPLPQDDLLLDTLIGQGARALGAQVYRASDLLDPALSAELRRALDDLEAAGVDVLLSIGDHAALRTAAMLAGLQRTAPRLRVIHVAGDPLGPAPGGGFGLGFFTAVDALTAALRELRREVRARRQWCVVECPGQGSDRVASCVAVAGEAEGRIGVAQVPVAMDGDALLDELTAQVLPVVAAHPEGGAIVLSAGVVGRGVWLGGDDDELAQGRPGSLAWHLAERVREAAGVQALGGPLAAPRQAPQAWDLFRADRLGAGLAGLVTAGGHALWVGLTDGAELRVAPFLQVEEVAGFVLATSWREDGGAAEGDPPGEGAAKGDGAADAGLGEGVAVDGGDAGAVGLGRGLAVDGAGAEGAEAAELAAADFGLGEGVAAGASVPGDVAPQASPPAHELPASEPPGPLATWEVEALERLVRHAGQSVVLEDEASVHRRLLDKDVADLSPDEVRTIISLHRRLLQVPSLTLRKLVTSAEVALWRDPQAGPRRARTLGGLVVDAGRTAGWSVAEHVARLGLDGAWLRAGVAPFLVRAEAGGLLPPAELFAVELADHPTAPLRIPVAEALIAAVRALARSEPDAAWLLERLTPCAAGAGSGFLPPAGARADDPRLPRWALEARRPLPQGAVLWRLHGAGETRVAVWHLDERRQGRWEDAHE